MKRQKGVSMSGFLLWSIVLIFVLLLSFKIGPPYFEFFKIQKQLQAVAMDSEARSGVRRDVENAFVKRSMVEDITAITPKDLVISKEGDGIVITAEYATCVPIVANLKACMDFSASSRKR